MRPRAKAGIITDPFLFNTPRTVAGAVANAERRELALHMNASWVVPAGRRTQIAIFGGPSYFHVKQGLVADVRTSSAYPYDTATFTGATTQRSHASKVGVNAGADLVWMFSSQIGAGGLVRFTRATVTEDSGNGRSLSLDAGGVQVAAGVRFLF